MFGDTRKQPTGLADLLLWFGLVDDGILLQRDGSLVAAWQYRGPDLQSATHAEMAAVAKRLNRILRLGGGWMIQVDCIRSFSSGYAPDGAFADPVTALIDRERREQFAQEGTHFENEYFLTLTYLPPLVASEKLEGFMISGASSKTDAAGAEALRYFKAKIRQFDDVFSAQLPVATMNGYTADLPITQIFPTLMSMLLFAFASWMIPKMAASIASGTLGAGAADLVGMGMEVAKGAALTAATVAVVAATGGAGAAAGGALAATETAGAAAEGASAAGSVGMSAAGGAGEAAMEASSAPPPPVPSSADLSTPSAPSAPPPPPTLAETPASAPSAPTAEPSVARNLQTLARHATNIRVPHDGSGHAPQAQLKVEREE